VAWRGAGDGDEVAVGVEGEVGDEAGDADGEAARRADDEGAAGARALVVEGVEGEWESAGGRRLWSLWALRTVWMSLVGRR
jgi:hypothetical protein